MYFDTHAHYDDEAFASDRATLLNDIFTAGVELIINPGCSVASSYAAAELADQYSGIYFAAGLHPEELNTAGENWLAEIEALANKRKCMAIGEIGLDYYWDSSNRGLQKYVFERQIKLALKLNLPVIIHDRDAHGDCLDIIRAYPELRGVFHCFSGSCEMAEELLKKGWYLGFDGPITYKNARKALDVIQLCPLDRILIETDSPYLSPAPTRGKRNDSRNLCHIVDKVAELKGLSSEDIAQITLENGKRLFSIE